MNVWVDRQSAKGNEAQSYTRRKAIFRRFTIPTAYNRLQASFLRSFDWNEGGKICARCRRLYAADLRLIMSKRGKKRPFFVA